MQSSLSSIAASMRWHASHKAMQSRPKRFMARRTADTVKAKGIQDGQPAGTGGGLTVTYDVAAEVTKRERVLHSPHCQQTDSQ
jgi:hypothetical protein